MKRSPFLAAAAASVIGVVFCLSAAWSQQPAAAPARGLQPGPANIAFIDLSKVFKSHNRFTMMTNEMKAALEKAEADIKKDRDEIKAFMERLGQYQVGSVEYKQLEGEIARRQSDLAVRVQMQKRDFLQREAQNHFTVYQEVMAEVEYFAANNGVAMVMRFNGEAADKQNPESVLREINKPVLWFPAGCDITDYIISRVNRADMNGQPNPQVGNRQGVPLPPTNNLR